MQRQVISLYHLQHLFKVTSDERKSLTKISMHSLTIIPPNITHSDITVTENNNQRKGENHISHLVENPWALGFHQIHALGIHQEKNKERKINSEPKGQNWFCIKFYINFSLFCTKLRIH